MLTLALDAESQAIFEALRREHYPTSRNFIPAHVSLFHQLPATEETRSILAAVTASTSPFEIEIKDIRSLGRGVTYALASDALTQLHSRLAAEFSGCLIPQDRQPFRPHVVVQNKVSSEQAQSLLHVLKASFLPWTARACGLLWWEYLGGPWNLLETFHFYPVSEAGHAN